ncbi:WbqC family protein [Shewanella halifaxensis]|uniref:WbqC family protein n=1 Tax=Shewanella halifaxensis TaxID=271098 RepID=UPI000D596D4C|nr:WbqC family protein [Shewanella halifaxensis]
MKLAIMQPYFLPYLGYFSLIYNTDSFVFFDTPQYTKKSWYERNRIINLQGGFTYIKVPIEKVKIGTSILDVKVNNSIPWVNRLYAQLEIYRKAPYYDKVILILNKILSQRFEDLGKLNVALIKEVLVYLGIEKNIYIYSELNLVISDVSAPDEWALKISKAMGATEYINSPGGLVFFSKEKYDKEGIELQFINQPLDEYVQFSGKFEAGLSIIDVLMFNSPLEVSEMLGNSYVY